MFLNESRARTAERCLSNYYFRYLHGGHGISTLRPSKPLIVGNLVHGGLAALYSEKPHYGAIVAALYEQLPDFDSLDADTKNSWLDEVEWSDKVIGRYAQWALGQDDFSVQGVEQSGSVVLGEECWQCGNLYHFKQENVPPSVLHLSCPTCLADAHHFTFRLDLLIRDDYGYKVIDHKTTASGVDEWFLKSFEYSTQMWGYCYGAEKMLGHKVGGYAINVIRKVKAAAEEPDMTKVCPTCKNGKNKKLSCETCEQTGRVPRAERPADRPFHREEFSFGQRQKELFVKSRTRLANKLVEHTKRLEEGDPDAFPHNPTSVGCDPELCWGRGPLNERYIPEERYRFNTADYVTQKRLAMEEGV